MLLTLAANEAEVLTPDNAVDVMEKLLPAQNKTFQLGLKFKLPEHEVESIHSTYSKPPDRLLHLIIGFTKKGKASWRVIVEALRSPAIGLHELASEIEAAYLSSSITADGKPDRFLVQSRLSWNTETNEMDDYEDPTTMKQLATIDDAGK